MNFRNYQNRRKLKKFQGIDLYAMLKPSAKFKLNWFTSFEIIPLLIFCRLTCILMGKHDMKKNVTKNTVYSNIPNFMKTHVLQKDEIPIKRNCYEISLKLVRFFFYN